MKEATHRDLGSGAGRAGAVAILQEGEVTYSESLGWSVARAGCEPRQLPSRANNH